MRERIIMTDKTRSKFHVEKKCLHCGETFLVRTCYIKRGQGKFCSTSCGTTYRNLTNNPSKNPKTKLKISANHADVSGENNPMYGKKGSLAPRYIDGRNKFGGDSYRGIALVNKEHKCEICNEILDIVDIHVHHKDENRKNNDLNNLQILCVKCHLTVAHKRDRDELGRFQEVL
jgi:5-methylcytosine-specific restriction endonuclease McrA